MHSSSYLGVAKCYYINVLLFLEYLQLLAFYQNFLETTYNIFQD